MGAASLGRRGAVPIQRGLFERAGGVLQGGAWAVEVEVYGMGKLKPGQAKPAADDYRAGRELTERFVIHLEAAKISTKPEPLRLTRKGLTTPWKPTLLQARRHADSTDAGQGLAVARVHASLPLGAVRHAGARQDGHAAVEDGEATVDGRYARHALRPMAALLAEVSRRRARALFADVRRQATVR